jgi:hypothetical protein
MYRIDLPIFDLEKACIRVDWLRNIQLDQAGCPPAIPRFVREVIREWDTLRDTHEHTFKGRSGLTEYGHGGWGTLSVTVVPALVDLIAALTGQPAPEMPS